VTRTRTSIDIGAADNTYGSEGLNVRLGSDIIIAVGAGAFTNQSSRIWIGYPLRLRIAGARRDVWRKYTLTALRVALNDANEGSEIRGVGRELDTAL